SENVGDCGRTGRIRTNVISLDNVSRRAAAGNVDAVAGVAADYVSSCGHRAADGIARGVDDRHAVAAVAAVGQRGGAGGVGADEIALNSCAAKAGASILINGLNLGGAQRAVIQAYFVDETVKEIARERRAGTAQQLVVRQADNRLARVAENAVRD